MSHNRLPPDADARIAAALREMYAPPTGPAYWAELEGRVMARLRQAPDAAPEWWQLLGGWTGASALAAGVAAIVAATVLVQTRAAERRVAYEAVVEAAPTPALAAVVRTATAPGERREATLRYVISH